MATFTSNFGAKNTFPEATYADRGFFGQLFNPNAIYALDWINNELAAENQAARDLFLQERQNEFNAKEAEKAYQRDREARQTYYQDMVDSLKVAGLNPVLAVNNSGLGNISAPSGASSGSGRTSTTNRNSSNSSSGVSDVATLLLAGGKLLTLKSL